MFTTPHTLKVNIHDNYIYCLIVENDDTTRDFYLINSELGDPVYMFTCKADDDQHAAHLARVNAILYTPDNW